MKAVIQRVLEAALEADGKQVARIGRGLAVYVGVEQADTEADIAAMCKKIAAMRIFSDGDGKMNLCVNDIGGDVLLISNFTLCADISHGNRPSFTGAMRPLESAKAMFDRCADILRGLVGAERVKTGVFGADMKIAQINDGPVTIIY